MLKSRSTNAFIYNLFSTGENTHAHIYCRTVVMYSRRRLFGRAGAVRIKYKGKPYTLTSSMPSAIDAEDNSKAGVPSLKQRNEWLRKTRRGKSKAPAAPAPRPSVAQAAGGGDDKRAFQELTTYTLQ